MSEASALRACNLSPGLRWHFLSFSYACNDSAMPVHSRGEKQKQEHQHLYLHGDLKLKQSVCFCSLVAAGWDLRFSQTLRSSCLVNAGAQQCRVAESCGCSIQPAGEQTSGAACRKVLSPQQPLRHWRPPTELRHHYSPLLLTHTVCTCILHIGTYKSKSGNRSSIWLWSWRKVSTLGSRSWRQAQSAMFTMCHMEHCDHSPETSTIGYPQWFCCHYKH